MNRIGVPTTIALIALLAVAEARGQGTFGQRQLGGTLTPGQRTLTSRPPGNQDQAIQDAGQITGEERFLRENRQSGQFVGSDVGDTRNFLSQLGGQAGQSGLGDLRAAADRQRNRGGSTNASAQRRPFRPALRVAFEYRRRSSEQIRTSLADRIAGASAIRRLGQIEVEVEGRTAVLRGAVQTPQARALAARLAGLEVGISDVRNELVVTPVPAGDPEDLPPPSVAEPLPDSPR